MCIPLTHEENRALNLREYRDGKIKLQSRPRYVMVELTQGCNLKCPMCRQKIIPIRTRKMSKRLFNKIAEELFSTAEMVDLRGWGESLILPDIGYYIETVAKYGCRIRFVTNLSFQRDDVLELLVKYGCYVAISLDTTDPELFRYLRGGANFNLVSKNIEKLVEGYLNKYGHTDFIHFTTTLQKPAIETLPDIINFAAEKCIQEIRLFSVTAKPSSPLSIDRCKQRVDKAIKRAIEVAKEKGIKLIAGTKLGSLPENPPDIPSCIHPWCYTYIAYDGSVGFCDHLIGPNGEPYFMGNLYDSSFEEIWNSKEWQDIRFEHLTYRSPNKERFKECSWCYKNRYIDFEFLFDPNATNRIVFLHRGGKEKCQ